MNLPLKAANNPAARYLTSSIIIRRIIFSFVGIVSIFAVSFAFLPWIASTRLIKDRISIELSAWSGFRISIANPPEIEVWPSFRALLTDVTLHQWGEWENPAFISVERLEIYLSALAALSGHASFVRVRMINPVITIPVKNHSPLFAGRIANAVETTHNLLKNNKDQNNPPLLPEISLGSLEFQNGRVVLLKDKEENLFTNVSGKIYWPSSTSSCSLELNSLWNNEHIHFNLNSENPLILLAGEKSSVSFRLRSPFIESSFSGILSFPHFSFLNGMIEISTTSAQKALHWTKIPLTFASDFESFSLAGKLSREYESLDFEGKVKINTDSATGSLSLKDDIKNPIVSGKLSFQTLDLKHFVSLFAPFIFSDVAPTDSLAHQARFNLNISSSKAQISPIELIDLKGNIISEEKNVEFHIQKASAFNGIIQTHLKLDTQKNKPQVEISFDGSDVDGNLLGKAIGLSKIFPASKGNVSGALNSTLEVDSQKFFSHAEGNLTAYFGKGNFYSPNLIEFIEKANKGTFFALSEISSESLLIDRAELNILINRGVGLIKKAQIEAGQQTIVLSGAMPYSGRSLALFGSIYSRQKVSTLNPAGQEARFFVGGSWDSPFVSAFP